MKLSILVVVYGVGFHESQTLQSLPIINDPVNLMLWNNGPAILSGFQDIVCELNSKGYKVKVVQTTENFPLSYIYNEFIDFYHSEKYLLFDHDTLLDSDYVESIISSVSLLSIPRIISNGIYHAPTVKGKVSFGPFSKEDKVISVGSGIALSEELVNRLKDNFGEVFDTRYSLYGVDTSFFCRVYNLKLSTEIEVISNLNHSLSRLDATEHVNQFRRVERSYDLGITLRYYLTLELLKIILKDFIKSFFGKSYYIKSKVFKGFFFGQHPKCIALKRERGSSIINLTP